MYINRYLGIAFALDGGRHPGRPAGRHGFFAQQDMRNKSAQQITRCVPGLPRGRDSWIGCLAALVWTLIPMAAGGVDTVVFRRSGQEHTVGGRVLVTAQDGGLLLLGRDGLLWAIPPEEQIKTTRDDSPFRPLSREELAGQLLRVLPTGFQVHETANYLVCYNTSKVYAQWCGALLERLFSAFLNYWQQRGLELSKPEFPLVAIVFADRKSYEDFSRPELGEAAPSIVAYYSLMTNRMTMYDLTGVEQWGGGSAARSRLGPNQITQILARPEAERTVATIIHEATHQIAFNCGLHQRLSDCPLWVSEGIAIYFETPDLHSAKGWRSIGAINRPRLAQFYTYLPRRPPDSLRTLIEKDERFRNPQTGLDAYAEAWALTYFLLKQRPKQYVEYLQQISRKKPLVWDKPETRLREFQSAFGQDLQALDAEFLRFMAKLR